MENIGDGVEVEEIGENPPNPLLSDTTNGFIYWFCRLLIHYFQ